VVSLTSDNPEVVPVPGELVIGGSDTYRTFTTTALAPGVATLTAEYDGASLTRTVDVVENVTVDNVGLQIRGGLSVGQSADLYVHVDALVAQSLPVSISVDKPEILSVPESMTIPSGDDEAMKSVTALEEGTAEVTVTVGDSSRTFQVDVVKDPTVLYVNAPESMLVGTTDSLYVELNASASPDSIEVTSSNPEVVSVTHTIYSGGIEGTLSAHEPGTATITIRSGDNFSFWFVSVYKAASLSYLSFPSPLVTGTAGGLSLYLNAPVGTKTEIALESSDPSVLEVPSSVTMPAGSYSLELPLIAGKPGYTLLSVTLNGVTRTTDVSVVDHAGFAQAFTTPGSVVKGNTSSLTVYLTAPAKEDLELTFTYEVEGVVSGPAKGVIPAGASTGQFLLSAKAAGTTTILIEGGGESTVTVARVVDKLELVSLESNAIEAGLSTTSFVGLNANNTQPVTITLESSDPDVFSVPESIVIPAGAQYSNVTVKGVGEGTATLKASYDGIEVTADIQVFPAAP
jgi:uncharacterized protein YjdB